ncbi:hypothetical protein DSL92_07265 [Billgrantia gudaonensis]|uniref:Uncharacterized protein n=1 Tax=Billgrantia gudaonensis TaxID=376427 RepID=A0A432JI76_9GAMM|nr:hypothetical protein DSL92_07265 [Halomonas gudaonensis]
MAEAPSHAYLSHSGHFGMVNSEPGYQNLVRFLFGDTRVTGRLVVERLPLPPSGAVGAGGTEKRSRRLPLRNAR